MNVEYFGQYIHFLFRNIRYFQPKHLFAFLTTSFFFARLLFFQLMPYIMFACLFTEHLEETMSLSFAARHRALPFSNLLMTNSFCLPSSNAFCSSYLQAVILSAWLLCFPDGRHAFEKFLLFFANWPISAIFADTTILLGTWFFNVSKLY
ncbi:hypothetical protein AX774_g2033 [Zancudomyces culisetae]|uniref:Uncharacterized protein n=1 Tax=Zancudomyces culisetae TaxID=1213189 RepID=A0A1R1PU07_ZANCU|nr:hypothetical protein AX774_g2033 [Zancudomyces culisetae]|eukprot:OMH84434.1 hypothetical protein AX774_g2033 [Zancudomyces culisetae]